MSRLGTPYQQSTATKTGDYTILHGDDFIPFNIAGAQQATLPTAASCIGDDVEKVVANLGTSGGTLTVAAAAGDTLTGASSLAPGTAVHIFKAGPNAWTAESPFSAEGLTSGTISTADSKGVSAGTRASVADSKAVSDSVLTSTADSKGASAGSGASVADSSASSRAASGSTLISTADSKGTSAGSAAATADSKALSVSVLTSTADSKAVSDGTAASVADSKAVSVSGNTSVADSKAVSDSVVISSLTSRVSSKGG